MKKKMLVIDAPESCEDCELRDYCYDSAVVCKTCVPDWCPLIDAPDMDSPKEP